jgi:hypothetical protein
VRLKLPALYIYLAHIRLLSARSDLRIAPGIEAEAGDAIKQRPNTFTGVMAETQEAFEIEVSMAQNL